MARVARLMEEMDGYLPSPPPAAALSVAAAHPSFLRIPYGGFSLFFNSRSPAICNTSGFWALEEKIDDGCCQFSSLWLVEKFETHHCGQRSMGTDIAGTGYKRDLTCRPNSHKLRFLAVPDGIPGKYGSSSATYRIDIRYCRYIVSCRVEKSRSFLYIVDIERLLTSITWHPRFFLSDTERTPPCVKCRNRTRYEAVATIIITGDHS